MEKKYGLSQTEYELMEYFWSSDEKKNYKQIFEFFNTEKGKNWKKQTLSSFLKILQDKELIKCDTSGKKYLYYPTCTKDEHIHMWVRRLVSGSFENSMKQFLVAFSGGDRLSDRDVAELKEYLDSME